MSSEDIFSVSEHHVDTRFWGVMHMPRRRKPIEQYDHRGKERLNNPPVGLVTPETDKETDKKTYSYDPHLDPRAHLGRQGRADLL